jgi:hypothetical protein
MIQCGQYCLTKHNSHHSSPFNKQASNLCYTEPMRRKKTTYYTMSLPVQVAFHISPDASLIVPEQYHAAFSIKEQDLQTISTKAHMRTLLKQHHIVSDELNETYPEYKDTETELIIDGEISTTQCDFIELMTSFAKHIMTSE